MRLWVFIDGGGDRTWAMAFSLGKWKEDLFLPQSMGLAGLEVQWAVETMWEVVLEWLLDMYNGWS
jgi:hypothetical protein